MNITADIITILLATFTGWAATWIAKKMLFHPRKPIHFLGFTVQGIFPKNQSLIAEKLGRVVVQELLSFDDIEAKVTNPDNLQKVRPDIEVHIDHFLRNKLKVVFPMLAVLMGEKTILQLKEAFLFELESLFPLLMKNYMNKLRDELDLEKIVTEKVAEFSSVKLEDIANKIIQKEFKFLELAGAGFGAIIGFVQVLITSLINV